MRSSRVELTLVCIFDVICLLCGCSVPDDAILIHRFQEHRGAFETLVTMSNEDPHVVRIAYDFTRLDNDWSWPRPESKLGLTPQRWDEYRRLFKETSLTGGLYRSASSKQLFFIAYSSGLTGRGLSLGYAYCGDRIGLPDSLPPCEAHVDSFTGDNYRYQKIDSAWYVFEEY